VVSKGIGGERQRRAWAALERGCDLYELGDIAEASKAFMAAAKLGLPQAQVNLANIYDDGKLGFTDRKTARYWYRRAAAHGLPQAACGMAISYKNTGNQKRYLSWMERAAALGDEDARAMLESKATLKARSRATPSDSMPCGNPTMSSHTPSGRPRARHYAIPFDGRPGPANAITDVPGVSVGYVTLIQGEGPLVVGQGPVRTGVTAILPRPRAELATPVFAGLHSANGNGEMTGAHIIAEIGAFAFPVTITNTHSCGVARDGTLRWLQQALPQVLEEDAWGLPVAAETYDGFLNDINGHHVTMAHVAQAIEAAGPGAIEEGSVGGGTGMICYDFKGGSGTASRLVAWQGRTFTVGCFVQANFGRRRNLIIRGRRAGAELAEPGMAERTPRREKGSIIAVVATDAPLLPHQLARLARRVPLGVAWTGGLGYHSSGDIFLAFSTANGAAAAAPSGTLAQASWVPDADLDPFFDAVVEGVEEAILNALVANADMTGRDGNFVPALPRAWLERAFG